MTIQPSSAGSAELLSVERYKLFRLLRADASFEKCREVWREIERLSGAAQASPDRDKIARILYECEKRRATNADAVVKGVFPNASNALLMEPWDECKDAFLSDAEAVLASLHTTQGGDKGEAGSCPYCRALFCHVKPHAVDGHPTFVRCARCDCEFEPAAAPQPASIAYVVQEPTICTVNSLVLIRNAVVMAIAFLGRDAGSDRAKVATPQIIKALSNADAEVRRVLALSSTDREGQ